jgi:precorrin-8X/cobalt-precorrin-8 methylmutase
LTVYEYEKIPAEIYRQSFDIIAGEAELSRFSERERVLVIRLIHACGMVDLADDVVISPGAIEAGINALRTGAPILCDVEMVKRGIIRNRLGSDNPVLCKVGSDDAVRFAASMNTTRSAGGIEALRAHIPGSIVAIGNAPTALFHLLELLHQGLNPPALIIGCVVGFVGAAESKQALIEYGSNETASHAGRVRVPYISVCGRRGGSAMTAAALNALAGLCRN